MDGSTLTAYKEWFDRYCATFYSSDENYQRNILLKEAHTRNVCADMVTIFAEERGGGEHAATAEAIALFHDVGRFEQYRRYRTFRDSDSENHAFLGVRVLAEHGLLDGLPLKEQSVIRESVRLHNVFAIPAHLDPEILPFLKLIRDADKLDIWRVFIEHFDLPSKQRASAVTLGLPDTGGYTTELLRSLYEKRVILLSRLQTVDDFKLLQLSWIFDLNSRAALRLLRERRYIRRLAATLPDDREVGDAVAMLEEHVDAMLQPKGSSA